MIDIDRTPHPIETLRPSRAERLLKVLTSYYAISLGVALLFAGVFAWLAQEVLESEFSRINTAVLLAIHRHTSDTFTTLAFAFTDLGSVGGVTVIGAILSFALWRSKRYVDLGTFAAVLVGAATMIFTLKLIFHQIRPTVFPPLAIEKNYSFPSGHSMISFSFWGFFAWWIISIHPRQPWRWFLAAFGLAIAACVGLSRLYLGVHWPTDVIGGMLLAFAWIGVCVLGQHWLTRHARRERRAQDAARRNGEESGAQVESAG
jgi:undecaprenyl-diphosphatase